MSHVVSVDPTEYTGQPGEKVRLTVTVSDVPLDDTHVCSFVGSDGIPVKVTITRDEPALTGVTDAGQSVLPNEVLAQIESGGGSIEFAEASDDNTIAYFDYTLPS